MASLTSIASGIGEVSQWFWGIFENLINTIATNSLMLWVCIFAIVAGCVGGALRVIRRFGLKGRR